MSLRTDPTQLPNLGAGSGVSVRGATRRFSSVDGYADALVDVSLDAQRGDFTVVAGPSGSGKSTLLMLISALDRGDSGRITVDGTRVDRLSTRARRTWRRDSLGFVMPQPSHNLTTVRNTIGNLVWADAMRGSQLPLSERDALSLLETFGLGHVASNEIAQLSGGEQMRLAFACATIGSPQLVVADEPTASLDTDNARNIVGVIRQLAENDITVLVATHDPELIEAADAVIRLDDGRRIA